MKAFAQASNSTSTHCAAVACSSAVIAHILDTALILAVSICVFGLPLRILAGLM